MPLDCVGLTFIGEGITTKLFYYHLVNCRAQPLLETLSRFPLPPMIGRKSELPLTKDLVSLPYALPSEPLISLPWLAFLYKNGRTFMAYSASSCTGIGYKLGLIELTGSDPLNPSSWKKFPDPVFQTANGFVHFLVSLH